MVKTKPKRKTRTDKFPLTLHKTGQYCKKIHGKLYYFGNKKQEALLRYKRNASDLYFCSPVSFDVHKNDNITLKDLCNTYLSQQLSRLEAGDLSTQYYADQVRSLRKFAGYIGPECLISQIVTIDLQNYRNVLRKTYKSAFSLCSGCFRTDRPGGK